MEALENNQFDFSVIVCCYNSDIEKLKKTLISIYKQKRVTYEVIISDDGSRVSQEEEIKAWLIENDFNNYKLNFLNSNVGTVKNIISAVKLSSGKYIKTISPGDYFAKEDALEKFKQKAIISNADLVYSDTAFYNENGIVMTNDISHKNIIYSKKAKKVICYYGGYFMGASFVATKSFYEEILYNFEDKVIYMEDRALIYVGYILNKRIVGIKDQLIWYEYGTGISTKTTHNEKLDKDEANIFKYIKEVYGKNRFAKRMNNMYESKKWNKLVRIFYYCFSFPFFFMYKLRIKISKPIRLTLNIDDLKDITSF